MANPVAERYFALLERSKGTPYQRIDPLTGQVQIIYMNRHQRRAMQHEHDKRCDAGKKRERR